MVTHIIVVCNNVLKPIVWLLRTTLSAHFVYHAVGVSGTEYPNKRAITKLRFHCRVNN